MDNEEQNLPFEFRNRPVSPEKKADSWSAIQTAVKKRRVFRFTAIAASAILVFALGIILFLNNKPNEQTIAVQNNSKHTDSALSFVRHEVNTTGAEKRIQLADGSLIVLSDKSEITYSEPFTGKRDITLTGKAYFKVAKDKTRPFTVISGDISTTALGTEFTVTSFKGQKDIIVRLYEGKVVIKPVNKANRKFAKDVYLLPGQEFVYSSQTAVKTKAFKLDNDAVPEEILNREVYRDNPSMPENTGGSWYMFNNQPLGQVLDQLADMYAVQINYDQSNLQNIYFTGKYNRSDSLEFILHEISILYNLTITKKDNAFIVSR